MIRLKLWFFGLTLYSCCYILLKLLRQYDLIVKKLVLFLYSVDLKSVYWVRYLFYSRK